MNSLPTKKNGTYYLQDFSFLLGNNYSQHYVVNLDPDLEKPNYYEILYEYLNTKLEKLNSSVINNWTFNNNNYWDDSEYYEGNRSAKVSLNIFGTSGSWDSELMSIKPNVNYTFSAQMKAENLSGSGAVSLREMDSNSNTLTVHKLIPISNANWTKVTKNFTSNSSARKAYIYINIWRGNGTLRADNVRLIEVGNDTNLIQNSGFENNEMGNNTNYTIDGIYIDSLSTKSSRSNIENYNTIHWNSTDYPLVFSYQERTPTLLNLFSQYEFVNNISNDAHNKNKILSGNVLSDTYGFYAHLFEQLGSETSDTESDADSSFRRTLSYNKTNTNSLSLNWAADGTFVDRNKVEEYIKSNSFYGIFPTITFERNYSEKYFWNASLYNRDRDLYKKYVPIIKEISKAGWEPIQHAFLNNSYIKVERFGSYDTIYYTLRNDESTSQAGVLTVEINNQNIYKAKVDVIELISGEVYELEVINGKINIYINVNPEDTLVYKIKY